MFRNELKYVVIPIITMLFFGCTLKTQPEGETVARVGSNTLSMKDVASVIPDDIGHEDSIMMAEDYIKKWIKQELLLQKAEENLSVADKDVSKQLEDYRKSLILYRYKNALMTQRMDTTVTGEEISNYYNDNPEIFILKKNIIKAIFIKMPADFANPEKIKQMCEDTSTEGIIELRDYCMQYAKVFDIFTERWVDFQLIAKNIPQTIENQEQFLKNNQIIEHSDEDYYYLVSIQDYKLKNEKAPLDYVEENIKNLILNRRKIDFLKQLENNIYTEGVENNKFEIFKLETNDKE